MRERPNSSVGFELNVYYLTSFWSQAAASAFGYFGERSIPTANRLSLRLHSTVLDQAVSV